MWGDRKEAGPGRWEPEGLHRASAPRLDRTTEQEESLGTNRRLPWSRVCDEGRPLIEQK